MADYGKVGEAFLELRADLSRLQGDLGRVQATIGPELDRVSKQVQGRLSKAFEGVGSAAGVAANAIAGIGAGAVFADVLKTAGDFEAQLKNVGVVSGATQAQLASLSATALKLGAETSFSASEAADAMKELAAAGFKVDEVLKATPGVLSLAAAGQLELGRAAEIAANTLGQFNLKAGDVGRVNDVLVTAANASSLSVEQLAQSFKFVGPVASTLGVSLEETAAALATLAQAGIKGEQGGTGLRGALSSLLTPSKAASGALEELGLTLGDIDPQTKGLAGAFAALGAKGASVSQLFTIFGNEGAGVAAILAKQTDALRGFTTAVTGNLGEAARVAAEKTKGFNGAIDQLSGAFETLKISVANSGILEAFTSIAQAAAGLVGRIAEMDPKFLTFAGTLTAFVAVVTPIAATVGVLALALGALGAPILAVGAALAVATAAFVTFYDDIQRLAGSGVEAVRSGFNGVVAALDGFDATVAGYRDRVVAVLSGLADAAVLQVKRLVDGVREELGARLKAAFDLVAAPVEKVQGLFAGLYDAVVGNSYIPDMVKEIGQWLGLLPKTMVEPVQSATAASAKAFAEFQASANKSMAGIAAPTVAVTTTRVSSTQIEPVDERTRKSYLELGEDLARSNEYVGALANNISDSLYDAAQSGKLSMKDLADSIIKDFQRIAIQQAVLAAIGGIGGAFGATGTTGTTGRYAMGGAFSGGVQRFAMGGAFTNQVIRKPTTFRMAKGMGLMGEAGPEAVMPLTRTASGKLGVQAEGGGGGGGTNIQLIDQRGASAPEIERRETRGPDGSRVIQMLIRAEMKRTISTGGVDREMGQRFNQKPVPR